MDLTCQRWHPCAEHEQSRAVSARNFVSSMNISNQCVAHDQNRSLLCVNNNNKRYLFI